VHTARGIHDIAHDAVDTEAHDGTLDIGLNMNVGRTIAQGLREQRVDHADYRGAILAVEQVKCLRRVLQQAGEIKILFDSVGKIGGRLIAVRIGGGEPAIEGVRVGFLNAQGKSESPPNFAQGRD